MDDEYATCAGTYATLRIYPERLDPVEVTARLGISPSSWQRRGEIRNPGSKRQVPASIHGWFLTSEGVVESRDIRRHLDWLIAQVGPKAGVLSALQSEGCRTDVSCNWLSRSGHGGPTVTPVQMGELARLGLELWFDVYFMRGEDVEADATTGSGDAIQ
jgi:hypothetical protein